MDNTNTELPNEEEEEEEPKTKCYTAACVYVSALSNDTPESKIKEHFDLLYNDDTRVMMRTGKSRPYAFIQFNSIEASNRAIEDSDKRTLDGIKIHIERARINSTLFVAKVPKNLRNADLREIAEEYGEVEQVLLLTSSLHESKGFGFVRYKYREDAERARQEFKVNKKWIVEWAEHANELDRIVGVERAAIIITGLDARVQEDDIRKKFEEYGEIKSLTLLPPKVEGRSPISFVRFTEVSSAIKAIENENGTKWHDKWIRVQHPQTTPRQHTPPQQQQQPRHQFLSHPPPQQLRNNRRTNNVNNNNNNNNNPNNNNNNNKNVMPVPGLAPYAYLPVAPNTGNKKRGGGTSNSNQMQYYIPPLAYPFYSVYPGNDMNNQ